MVQLVVYINYYNSLDVNNFLTSTNSLQPHSYWLNSQPNSYVHQIKHQLTSQLYILGLSSDYSISDLVTSQGSYCSFFQRQSQNSYFKNSYFKVYTLYVIIAVAGEVLHHKSLLRLHRALNEYIYEVQITIYLNFHLYPSVQVYISTLRDRPEIHICMKHLFIQSKSRKHHYLAT